MGYAAAIYFFFFPPRFSLHQGMEVVYEGFIQTSSAACEVSLTMAPSFLLLPRLLGTHSKKIPVSENLELGTVSQLM